MRTKHLFRAPGKPPVAIEYPLGAHYFTGSLPAPTEKGAIGFRKSFMMISISVVTHGHQVWVRRLLRLISDQNRGEVCRVWLTVNKPEPFSYTEEKEYSFDLVVIENPSPMSFSHNHNRAFGGEMDRNDSAQFFSVINPDLYWSESPWPALIAASRAQGKDCFLTPVQLDESGRRQDFEREWPTLRSLFRRVVEKWYWGQHLTRRVDWVNGAFLFFNSELYGKIGGFSERYRMYCEDVDLCLRAVLLGYDFHVVESVTVYHAAQRQSSKRPGYLLRHITSMARLWCTPEWKKRHTVKRLRA